MFRLDEPLEIDLPRISPGVEKCRISPRFSREFCPRQPDLIGRRGCAVVGIASEKMELLFDYFSPGGCDRISEHH